MQPKTYIRDARDESDISGMIILDTDGDELRVTENRDESSWCAPFWMPEDEFAAFMSDDTVKPVSLISTEKLEQILTIATEDVRNV